MEPRIANFPKVAQGGYQAMLGVEAFVRQGPVPKPTLELVKIRASQINGCGFCLDMHAKDARAAGETDERLFTVAGWREAPYYTPAERAALALTEAVTRLADGDGVSDKLWAEVSEHYDDEALAVLLVAIAQINSWNRINVANRTPAGHYRPRATT
ncbi:alkyl hydroperoxide reductase AhpD [Sphaerisporangium rufum]|uniref:Alkyl hydroperoxide reductase AhpD n=1 Tax=Sphaerisporangium rufum TaxID=1381558 RepID=A0A919V270_9ACTN|nr:carboxymuconolactone decarboxylase family protein [Sphaerisporangium rufum]GII79392.1 alkyl hydroperoxide reductase AhpD [Sphaerisporangium rufum]